MFFYNVIHIFGIHIKLLNAILSNRMNDKANKQISEDMIIRTTNNKKRI